MKTRIQHVNSPSTSEENFLSQTADQNTPIRGAVLFNTETLSQNLPPPFPVEQSEAPRYSQIVAVAHAFFRLVCIINHICRFFSSPFYYIELLASQCNKSQSPALLWNFITPFNVSPHHVIFLPLDQCIFQSVASHSMYTSRIFFPLSRKFSSINDRGSHWDYSPVISDHPSRSTTNNCLYQRLLNFN